MEQENSEKEAKKPPKHGKGDELTKKEELFCQEYVIDHNGTRAAKVAGYSQDSNAAAVWANRLVRIVKIQKRIQEIRAEFRDGFNPLKERIMLELTRMSFYNAQDAFDEMGNLIPVHLLDRDMAAAIQAFDVQEIKISDDVTGVVKKIKLANKKDSIALMAQLSGLEPASKTDITSAGQPISGVVITIPTNGRNESTPGTAADNWPSAGLPDESTQLPG